MIVKDKEGAPPQSKTGRAGFDAEKQMAFYLRREFAESPDIRVFNDLRLIRNGEVAQIDHLILHRFGFFLIESKSVTDTIEVDEHLEFVRVFGRQRRGMKSPIVQVKMQSNLLGKLLNDHKESLRRKLMFGMVQGYFGTKRFDVLVAISDNGLIKRKCVNPPELVKAERVTSIIKNLIERRRKATGIGGAVRFAFADKKKSKQLQEDDLPAFSDDEMAAISEFLTKRHQPFVLPPPVVAEASPIAPSKPTPPPVHQSPTRTTSIGPSELVAKDTNAAIHSCRHCNSSRIEIVYGRYGYYFKCLDCEKNTRIDSACGCGNKARISKSGLDFRRKCSSCGAESHFFTNPTTHV